ncbi:MAG: twin-arginine translocase subunit TatC [bacterium]|nr:twin-arginine translocase subunit TatC [bacterium]
MLKKPKISFDDKLPITHHLAELRQRLIAIIIVLAVFFSIAYTFSEYILAFIKKPLQDYCEFIFTSPTEVFCAHMKMSFFVALFLSAPLIFYQLWAFISPGLLQKEKRYTLPIIVFTSIFFIIGVVFGSMVVVPFGVRFLMTYKVSPELIAPKIKISEYLSFYSTTVLINGVIFELPFVILFLTKIGLVKPQMLTKNRKWAMLIIFIVSAIFTPPDVFSQFLMAIPLIILYEISIIGSKLVYWSKRKESQPGLG